MARRSRQSKDVLGSVARWYYLQELSQSEIGKRLDPPKDQAAVARILKEAKERGVLKIDIDPDFAIGGVDDEHLASLLGVEFDLRDPIVVDADVSTRTDPRRRDDDLHIAIANHTGMRLRQTIASGDHIGVSGGRAGVRLATVIGRNPPSRRNITVTPLSGRLWNGRLWEIGSSALQLEQPLNADYSALILAVGLYQGHAPGIRFSQISHPLHVKDRSQAEAIMRTNCAFLPEGGWNWDLKPPNKAFVGVGVVDPDSGHRVALHFTHQVSVEPPFSQLKRAQQFVAQHEMPYFGDVANRLFAALPLPDQIMNPSSEKESLNNYTRFYRKLISELDQVNQQSIVMQWRHLRDISSVLAVAGGQLKVNCLWTLLLTGLLHPELRIITELATDDETAKQLLKARREYDRASAAVKDWYTDITADLFRDVQVKRAAPARS